MGVISPLPATDWKQRLDVAVRQAKGEVIGASLIQEYHHARLVVTALEALGDDPRSIFYIEGRSESARTPRPDLIVIHPETGIVVIENKGIDLSCVHDVQGTTLKLIRDGRLREEDPFLQAERVMFSLRDLAGVRMDLREALFLSTAALPCISREKFAQFGGSGSWQQALFADECSSADRFREHLILMAQSQGARAGKVRPLSAQGRQVLLTILNGKGYLGNPRRVHLEIPDRELIGAEVQELELTLKEPTRDQKEIGKKDLRGSHWLFRGVAGSGKSIMLILSVAHTLSLFQEEANGLFRSRTKRILVVCYNRTLVHYLQQRIDERYARIAWEKPPPGLLRVTHIEALIRELERAEPSLCTGLSYDDRRGRATALNEQLDKLEPAKLQSLQFDAIYVDEGQDFEPEEYQLLLRLGAKDLGHEQTLVIFFDNAQNIYGMRPPVWSNLGINIKGRTHFLDKCLRNTREVLAVAFNLLVGSYAAPGEQVATRGFADLDSLRRNGLIEEKDGRIEVLFAQRSGPVPYVREHPSRESEIAATAEMVRRLVEHHKVLPSDILIVYRKPASFQGLSCALYPILGDKVRYVDRAHQSEKNRLLFEDGVLTVSTIASAKGYDAPIVFLLGVDQLSRKLEDRASFYVGATRAKHLLVVSGVHREGDTLLAEILRTTRAIATADADLASSRPAAPSPGGPLPVLSPQPRRDNRTRCQHCGSPRLHAQQGTGYYFVCIDCTLVTPIARVCPVCSARAYVRKKDRRFFRKCSRCGSVELLHTNVPLDSLFQ